MNGHLRREGVAGWDGYNWFGIIVFFHRNAFCDRDFYFLRVFVCLIFVLRAHMFSTAFITVTTTSFLLIQGRLEEGGGMGETCTLYDIHSLCVCRERMVVVRGWISLLLMFFEGREEIVSARLGNGEGRGIYGKEGTSL